MIAQNIPYFVCICELAGTGDEEWLGGQKQNEFWEPEIQGGCTG